MNYLHIKLKKKKLKWVHTFSLIYAFTCFFTTMSRYCLVKKKMYIMNKLKNTLLLQIYSANLG